MCEAFGLELKKSVSCVFVSLFMDVALISLHLLTKILKPNKIVSSNERRVLRNERFKVHTDVAAKQWKPWLVERVTGTLVTVFEQFVSKFTHRAHHLFHVIFFYLSLLSVRSDMT